MVAGEATEARHEEVMETERVARQTLELALERQSEATDQLDQRLQREMENALTHKTRADMLAREQTGGAAGGVGSAAGEAAEDAKALRSMEQMQGIVLVRFFYCISRFCWVAIRFSIGFSLGFH